MLMNFDVLICVWRNDCPKLFEMALQSIFDNTLQPQKVLLVIDGKIGSELNLIITKFQDLHKNFAIIKRSQNKGLASSLNVGLKEIDAEICIRCDADDINEPNRFEKLISAFCTENADVIGSKVIEIDHQFGNNFKKEIPLKHDEIVVNSLYRNPINHMSVAFKTELVVSIGGYPNLYLMEDYGLWLKLIGAGGKFLNLSENLVKVNAGQSMIARRKNLRTLSSEWKLMSLKLENLKDSSRILIVIFSLFRIILLLGPTWSFKLIYYFSRRKVCDDDHVEGK